MSVQSQTRCARRMFGEGATVTEIDGWFVLQVPGHEAIRIGRNDSEATNALNLAEAAGGIGALWDGMSMPNPSWRARGNRPRD
jgi:hypothetical protein